LTVKRGGFHPARPIQKKHPRSHITKSLPLSQFLADFFISSAKIHLKDSTRAIGDSASNVGGRFSL